MFSKNLIKNSIYNSGLVLLIFLTVTLIFSSILFLFRGTIGIASAIISILISVSGFFILAFKKSKIEAITGLILGAVLFTIFIIASQNIFDFASDSNWYHKAALGSLANGWNPVYESFSEFANNSELNITDMHYAEIYTQHYCKASWIVGANIYCLTRNIEAGKAVNLVMAYILFAFAFHYFSMTRLRWWQSIIVSALIVYNPLVVSQIFTLYVDNLLYTCLIGIIVVLFGISDEKYELDEKIKYISLFGLVVFCINIKFTGLAYAGVFCLLFYIIWIIQSIINKNFMRTFVKNTLFYMVTCIIAIFLVGFSTYVTNYVDDGHPFYPLAGENKRDIMTGNQPRIFNKINGAQRLVISMFSKTENIAGNKLPDLKFPFYVSEDEEEIAAIGPDTRMAGFGPLFGAILCCSAAILALELYYLFGRSKYWFIVLMLNIITIFTLLFCIQESWWARYSPYFYLIPIFAVVLMFIEFNNKFKFQKFLMGLACIVFVGLLVKNCNYFSKYVGKCVDDTIVVKENFKIAENSAKENPLNIFLASSSYYGLEFNLKDADINYVKVEPFTVKWKELYGTLMFMEDVE